MASEQDNKSGYEPIRASKPWIVDMRLGERVIASERHEISTKQASNTKGLDTIFGKLVVIASRSHEVSK